MAKEINGILTLESHNELEERMFYHNCQTQEELEDLLYKEYDTTLILDYEYSL